MPSPAKALSADAEVVPRLRKRNTPQWKHVVQALHVSQRPRPKTKHQKREMKNQDDEYYGELSGIYFQRSCVDAAVRVDAYLACQELHGKNTKTGPVHCQVHCFFSDVESPGQSTHCSCPRPSILDQTVNTTYIVHST